MEAKRKIELRAEVFHLPGQHDQESHGGEGGSSAGLSKQATSPIVEVWKNNLEKTLAKFGKAEKRESGDMTIYEIQLPEHSRLNVGKLAGVSSHGKIRTGNKVVHKIWFANKHPLSQ